MEDIFGDDTVNVKMETDEIEEFGKTNFKYSNIVCFIEQDIPE